jgi:NAD(P)-dependent dehydrogenase (short-subunit alcohol dehydrogenase family)
MNGVMARTILVCGHGPGISDAVARKFGDEGFQVALVARSAERLGAAAKALGEAGITAAAFPCDLGDPAAVKRLVADVRNRLGPVTVIHWNAYSTAAGDLTTADLDDLRKVFDVCVVGAVAAVQEALPDLRSQPGAAVLLTGGGFAFYSDQVDKMIVQWSTMGVALAKAAQHKLTGVLHHKLAADGIYVGSITVLGVVKGTAFDKGQGMLEARDVAGAFWQLYQDRTDVTRNFPASP